MCLTRQSKTTRLVEDRIYWKVFYRNHEGELEVLHKRNKIAQAHGKSNKKFDTRNGYQVFETFRRADSYTELLKYRSLTISPDFIVRKVLVKRGALKREGVIKTGYIGSGRKAIRVSSYIICKS